MLSPSKSGSIRKEECTSECIKDEKGKWQRTCGINVHNHDTSCDWPKQQTSKRTKGQNEKERKKKDGEIDRYDTEEIKDNGRGWYIN